MPVILVLAAVMPWPSVSSAGVAASPHDLEAQDYAVVEKTKKKKNSICNYCHVPHKAKGARIWATLPPSLKAWGTVGPICYSCHDGVAIVSPHVDASNTAFNPKSHGLDIEDLPEDDDVSEAGLPYTGDSKETNIECSTCHNPHDNTSRPFVRAPLTELCQKCHQRRENSGYNLENAESTHPVHKLPLDEVENDSPIDVQADFKVRFPLDYPSEHGKDTMDVHWTLGGHLAEGDEGAMECVTCHSVHGKERTGPQSEKLLSKDPVMKNSNEFCEGCHRGKRGDGLGEPPFPNPGGTELPRTYHAADNDEANGPGRIANITEPEDWVFGEGREVLCTTCHKPHDALENSPILRPMKDSETFCEECHKAQDFNHHPSGSSAGSSVNSGKEHADTRVIEYSGDFVDNGITYGAPEDGVLYCSSCHRAHNAKCEPILIIDCEAGGSCDICLQCHPKFNPTWQTDEDWKATHFMGDPTVTTIDKVDIYTALPLPETQAGYYDQYPPMNREAWPESGLESQYGGFEETEITCCSCHSFGVDGITAGDADESPYDGTSLAPGYVESDLTAGLLARAGHYKEWLDSDVVDHDLGGDRGTVRKVDKYLCTGCHGLTPNTHPELIGSEGMSHALMDADGTMLAPNAGQSMFTLANANFTFNNHINCEACHKAHEADTKGGFFILRETDLRPGVEDSPPIDPYVIRTRDEIEFAPLCHRCHVDY